MSLSIESSLFGVTKEGRSVEQYALRNNNGIEVRVITFGGVITSLLVPDEAGRLVDIILGYDTLQQYESCGISMGCIVGRYGNRIANACFTLDGVQYPLEANNNGHHLHGGSDGFQKVVWNAEIDHTNVAGERLHADQPAVPRLVLSHVSKDGQGGYPGTLQVQVAYSLNDDNELTIQYQATTNRPTVINLTSHGYFNLKGHQYAGVDGVLGHQLQISAEQFVSTNNEGIPLPDLCDVEGTPMDFRTATAIGDHITSNHQQLVAGSGYDHTWVLSGSGPLRFAALLSDPESGRRLQVSTTQPGMQFYTANHVNHCAGKAGAEYQRRGAVCLETQHFPDSPNRPDFPSTVLRETEKLSETTVYRVYP